MTVLDPTVSGINEIKSLSNGGVLLKCNTNEEVALIEQQLKEKEGENYTMKEANNGGRNRVKVVGMTKKYENEELALLIKKQHLSENDYVRVLKVYEDKNTRRDSFNAIIEFDTATAENVPNMKPFSIAWDMCNTYSYIRINRCFKCLGFNHQAKDCKNKIACSKCGGAHKVEDCSSDEMACVNCMEYVKKSNENIDTKHHAFAYKCWCRQQIVNKLMNKTNIGEK